MNTASIVAPSGDRLAEPARLRRLRRNPARCHRYRDPGRHHHRPVRRHRGAGREQRQRGSSRVRRGEREGRHQRPQDPLHRRGQPVPGAARGAGDEQAAQQRRRVLHHRGRRHADEQRHLPDGDREERAEAAAAVGRALDVRAVQQAEVQPVFLVRRSDAGGREVLRRAARQEGDLRDVSGHRLRQGRAGRCAACRPRRWA